MYTGTASTGNKSKMARVAKEAAARTAGPFLSPVRASTTGTISIMAPTHGIPSLATRASTTRTPASRATLSFLALKSSVLSIVTRDAPERD